MNAKPTIVLEINHVLVDFFNPPGSFREADSIAGRGIPAANCLQLTEFIMAGPVLQHRGVVYECIQISADNSIYGTVRGRTYRTCITFKLRKVHNRSKLFYVAYTRPTFRLLPFMLARVSFCFV